MTDFAAAHRAVLDEAQAIYEARSQVRGQMWIGTSIRRELEMIQEKHNRAQAALQMGLEFDGFLVEFIDSLEDLINFAVFAINKARSGKVE